MFKIIGLAILFLALVPADIVAQEVVTKCYGGMGYKYYLRSTGVGSIGWKTDKITDGYVILETDAQGNPVITLKDKAGLRKGSDGLLWLLTDNPLIKMVGFISDDSISIYLFNLDIDNNGTLLLSSSRAGVTLPSAGILKFECRAP